MSYETKIIKNDRIGEEYTYVKHPSGLSIYIWKHEGFSTTDAFFGTKYGSINTRFKTEKDDDFVDVPEGIAHFLEHKLFENEDCDVFELYAKTGANANAYTSFDQTVYLFNCSDKYLESLEILLDFVQSPYFTQETVDKEQGIIGQEIKMVQDSPDRQAYFNLLKCLYVNHPVKVDIAGTVESIAKIDADLLYRCYHTFYNLNNMALCISGNVDVDDVLAVCDKHLKPCENIKLETAFPYEPDEVSMTTYTEKMAVSMPIFYIGFKCLPKQGRELIKAQAVANVLMNLIMGPTSDLYKQLTDEGLINSHFGTEVFFGDGYFTCNCGGESKNPQEVKNRIFAEIERLRKEGLDRERFENYKKAIYGMMVKSFENSENCVTMLINADFLGIEAFDEIETYAEMTFEDITNGLDEYFNFDKSAISIVEPVE